MDFLRRWMIAVVIIVLLFLGGGYRHQQVVECRDVNALRSSTTTYIQKTLVRSDRALVAMKANPSSSAGQVIAAQKNYNELADLNATFEEQLAPRTSCSFF